MPYLKTETVELQNGESVVIQQLSGLDRFELQDYIFNLEKPVQPEDPGEDASESEREAHESALHRWIGAANYWRFKVDCRRVAIGLANHEDLKGLSIDERQTRVSAMFSSEDIGNLDVRVLKLSGMYIDPDSRDQAQDDEEPVDPKA